MCFLCIEYEKGKLTRQEAFKNLTEVFTEENPHHMEIWERLLKDDPDLKDVYWDGNGD